jgi:hypothetical protein
MLRVLHLALYELVWFFQQISVPLCFGIAWLLVGIIAWSLWSALRDMTAQAKQMHSVPCANCQFFTNQHFLKCPVHPSTALSSEAINCPDYRATGYRTIED